jgi:RNA recognition motif-containing protein
MGKKLYVGNMSYEVDSLELQTLFSAHGTVTSAEVIADRDTGRSKGFGFVEMGTNEEAEAAITALNGQDHGGRALTVNEAKPKEKRTGGGGGSYGGGGYAGSSRSSGNGNDNDKRGGRDRSF